MSCYFLFLVFKLNFPSSNDGSKTGSPKKPPFLRYEDLTSRVEPNFTPRRSSAGGEDFVS